GLSQKSRRWAVLGVLLIVGTFWDGPRMTPFHMKEQISCQSGANVALIRKMADGTYYAYFPFAILTEASQ
ncbi:MAG: hypothetical protein J6R90_00690, partial [Alistipes sp.]|nr:hypothetical protein [Alistipes sp.]